MERQAAGPQGHLLERLGFRGGTGHGRARTGGPGETGSLGSASGQRKAARRAGARTGDADRHSAWLRQGRSGGSGWSRQLGGDGAAEGRSGRTAVTGGRPVRRAAPRRPTPSGKRGNGGGSGPSGRGGERRKAGRLSGRACRSAGARSLARRPPAPHPAAASA